MPRITGIYKITSPDGCIYIGQSRDIHNRLRYYLPKISDEILDKYEVLYMDLYKNCNIELLNVKEGGRFGAIAESTKNKIRIAAFKRWENRDGNIGLKPYTFGKKVICIKTNAIYANITIAALKNNIKRSTLSMQLRGVNKNNTTLRYL
jgi:predicted GIY-YIG superfamily endonuclease